MRLRGTAPLTTNDLNQRLCLGIELGAHRKTGVEPYSSTWMR
jgi:hypothetical protein